jgi:hypothetical protein
MKRAELVAVAAGLTLVGVITYGSYVAHAGFYADDWADLAGYQLAHGSHYWTDVSELEHTLGGRPMLALLLPIPDALFGTHSSLHLGLALALGIATSLCIYVLLRTLNLGPPAAGAIAILALLFPWSDSVRLWPTASVLNLSICFLCLGVVTALRGLEHEGRVGVAYHTAADALYVLSVLTYEATGAAALLAGALYLRRAPRRTATKRWIADVVCVLAALMYSLLTTVTARHVGTIGQRIADVPQFVRQSALLLAAAILPVGRQSVPVQALVLIAVGAVVVLAIVRVRRAPSPALTRWLWWGCGALVALAAAYFMFLGSQLHPLDPGIETRTNILAGPIVCVLVYAIVAGACALVLSSERTAAIAATCLTAAIAVGYAVHLHNDESAWRRASTLQHRVLDALDAHLPHLPGRSTLVSFDQAGQSAPEVPVFDSTYDLEGALQLRDRDSTVRAYPIFGGVRVHCGPSGVSIEGPADYGVATVGYRSLFFLDAADGRGKRITSQRDCIDALPSSIG